LYDAVVAPLFAGFFSRVASELAELVPEGRILEVGSGPGRLAVKLAEASPGIRVTGIDITPEMVQMAGSLAGRRGVADRVEFQIADVVALPFPDASFDAVVSTFSLHHWRKPGEGLAEIHRVLRPGGVAQIYDLGGWITRIEQRGAGMAELIEGSPFGQGKGRNLSVVAGLGPLPLICRADLRSE
jgi:ubiquinone/menaquinone biosynthesis C-methylase UbiE